MLQERQTLFKSCMHQNEETIIGHENYRFCWRFSSQIKILIVIIVLIIVNRFINRFNKKLNNDHTKH